MKLMQAIQELPDTITFSEVIAYIDTHYDFTPTRFVNGETVNEAGQNNGSCKIFLSQGSMNSRWLRPWHSLETTIGSTS
jgi:hypothetical protein